MFSFLGTSASAVATPCGQAEVKFKPPAEALDFLDFVNNSPSPFHAVEDVCNRLVCAGFTQISERNNWNGKLKPGGKYFFTRNKSSIVAFALGGKYISGNGFSIVGAHTDSPCLKIKPISAKEKYGYLQVCCELYGGGIWHTWFDRDLSVAGRILVEREHGVVRNELVRINRPILRIPTLAIHLDREVNKSFSFNSETQLVPILATVTKALTGDTKPAAKTGENAAVTDGHKQPVRHHSQLLDLLASELGVSPSALHDMELCLYDTQPSALGGLYNEFVYSPRLDNLCMSYCSLEGLIRSLGTLDEDPCCRVVALFDNEEVGSTTAHGADSDLLPACLKRIASASIVGAVDASHDTAFLEAIPKSYLISADMAHAVHPNYADKHEDSHRPAMHKGVVVKQNANQRYATTAATSHILREVAKQASVPLQEFVVRNDSPCGSTIGPMLSAKLGLRTIDVGNPQLSMHSIREVAGTDDIPLAIKLFATFFSKYASIDAKMVVDD